MSCSRRGLIGTSARKHPSPPASVSHGRCCGVGWSGRPPPTSTTHRRSNGSPASPPACGPRGRSSGPRRPLARGVARCCRRSWLEGPRSSWVGLHWGGMYPPCARCGYPIGGPWVATPRGVMHAECAAPPPPPIPPHVGPVQTFPLPVGTIAFFGSLLAGALIVGMVVHAREHNAQLAREHAQQAAEDAAREARIRADREQSRRDWEAREQRIRDAAKKPSGGSTCPITRCCDGACSSCTGRGCCSHHGGVCGN